MLHDEPLDFIWLGVLLERVGQTARMLDVHHHIHERCRGARSRVETALWLSLLRALLRLRGVHEARRRAGSAAKRVARS